jgi:hypothetical protein
MTEELRGIIPKAFKPFLFPLAYQQVTTDWLLWEVIRNAEEVYPILKEMAGWRRAEIIDHCSLHHEAMDRAIFEMYGAPGASV